MDGIQNHGTVHTLRGRIYAVLRIVGILLLATPLVLNILPQPALAVSVNIAVNPSSVSVPLGSSFSIDILVNAGAQSIDAVDAHLNFDPSYLQVTGITWVSLGLAEMQKTWNNTAGTIDCAGATFSSTSGNFVLCTVQFQAIAATAGTPLTFVFTPLNRKTQAQYLGVDYCGGDVTNGTVTIVGAGPTTTATPTNTPTLQVSMPTPTRTPTPTLPLNPTGVVMYISPATKTVWFGGVFSLQIRVGAGPQAVDLAEAHLGFNPTYLEVLGITNGGVLPNELQNSYDNVGGTIDYVASTLSAPPTGDWLLATVNLRAKAVTAGTPLTFVFSFPIRQTKAEYLGVDRLTASIGGNVAINALGVANLCISPASSNVPLGVIFSLDVMVNSGSQPVDLAEAHIDFDPGYLEVLGITDGGNLASVLQSQYNNVAGTIDYAAGALGSPPSGSFLLCRLQLRAIALTPGASLNFVFAPAIRQTKVEYSSYSILGTATGATVQVNSPNPVYLYVLPASKTVWLGDVFSLQVRVGAGSQPIDLVEAHLDFNPTYLEVLSIVGSGLLPNELQNSYDNTGGTIDYAAGTLSTPPTGDWLLATVNLRAKAVTAGTPLTFVFTPSTRQTKAEYQGIPALGVAFNGNVVINALGSVNILIFPASTTVVPGAIFSLDVRLETGSQPVDLAEAHIDFNSSHLEVLGITDGGNLSSVLQSQYNNVAGTIDYAAGALGLPPSGSFLLCHLQLRAIALTPGTPLNFVFAPATRQTKVLYNGNPLLGNAYDGTVIVAEATPTPTTTPTTIPTPTRTATPGSPSCIEGLLFQSERDGNWEIYLAGGCRETRLTNHVAADTAPGWSPNEQYVIFQSIRDGNWEIYQMNRDGSNLLNLSRNPAADTAPSWIGNWIYFQSNRDGNWEIYRMNPDGSAQTRLTNNPAADAQPSASNDGRVAFQSKRDGNWEIYIMNLDGSGLWRLTNTLCNEVSPTWSPGSDRIAFQTDCGGKWQIAVMDLATGGLQYIARAGDAAGSPTWHSSGDWIFFQGLYYGDWDIYRVKPDGTFAQRVVFYPYARDLLDDQVLSP